jgi:hypothetical protein
MLLRRPLPSPPPPPLPDAAGYLNTGEARIMGSVREVVALHKVGGGGCWWRVHAGCMARHVCAC